jgi:hypothetical protein
LGASLADDQQTYKVNYLVKPTKAAIKQGRKLPLSEKERLEIIRDVQLLKHWSGNASNYDCENAFGAIEFKYDLSGNRWIRVMVFQDDIRKIMWVIRVFAKKNNQIGKADKIGIENAVTRMKNEIKSFERRQKNLSAKEKLNLVSGGKQNE